MPIVFSRSTAWCFCVLFRSFLEELATGAAASILEELAMGSPASVLEVLASGGCGETHVTLAKAEGEKAISRCSSGLRSRDKEETIWGRDDFGT